MPRPEAGQRLRRLLAILPWLAREGGASIDTVAERTMMEPEEVVALLELAACCGLPPYTPDQLIELIVDEDRVEANVGPLLSRPARFSAAEGFSLAASARAILATPGADPGGSLARALSKLEAVLGDHERLAIDIDEPEHLELVRDAAAESQSLEVDYYSASRDEMTHRRVDPYRVHNLEGHWYVDAWCHLAGGTRRFRLDRIDSARVTGDRFEQAAGGGVGAGHRLADPGVGPDDARAFVPGPETGSVRLRLPPGAGWVLEGLSVDDPEELPGGRTEVTLPVGGRAWLERLLLQLGAEARVLAPPELTDVGRQAARRLLGLYTGRTGRTSNSIG